MSIDWKALITAVLGTALGIAGLLYMTNQILFESYMPKGKAVIAHTQLSINQIRDEYQYLLLKGKNRTPAEEVRYGQLRERLENLRRSRDKALGIE